MILVCPNSNKLGSQYPVVSLICDHEEHPEPGTRLLFKVSGRTGKTILLFAHLVFRSPTCTHPHLVFSPTLIAVGYWECSSGSTGSQYIFSLSLRVTRRCSSLRIRTTRCHVTCVAAYHWSRDTISRDLHYLAVLLPAFNTAVFLQHLRHFSILNTHS